MFQAHYPYHYLESNWTTTILQHASYFPTGQFYYVSMFIPNSSISLFIGLSLAYTTFSLFV